MESHISVYNGAGANLGDWVIIELADSRVLGAAFKMYLLPLIAMLTTVLLSEVIFQLVAPYFNSEIISAILGFAAVALVYIFIRNKYESEDSKEAQHYVSVITKILDEDDFTCEDK